MPSREQYSYVSIENDEGDKRLSQEISPRPQEPLQTTKLNRFPRYTTVISLVALLGSFTLGVLVSKFFLLDVLSMAHMKVSMK
jgi:hypothetical protein